MPTKREREYYRMGFRDGQRIHLTEDWQVSMGEAMHEGPIAMREVQRGFERAPRLPRKKRKLSAWQKFVKANSRKKEFRYRDGKLNLKKMGVAYRRKKRR